MTINVKGAFFLLKRYITKSTLFINYLFNRKNMNAELFLKKLLNGKDKKEKIYFLIDVEDIGYNIIFMSAVNQPFCVGVYKPARDLFAIPVITLVIFL